MKTTFHWQSQMVQQRHIYCISFSSTLWLNETTYNSEVDKKDAYTSGDSAGKDVSPPPRATVH